MRRSLSCPCQQNHSEGAGQLREDRYLHMCMRSDKRAQPQCRPPACFSPRKVTCMLRSSGGLQTPFSRAATPRPQDISGESRAGVRLERARTLRGSGAAYALPQRTPQARCMMKASLIPGECSSSVRARQRVDLHAVRAGQRDGRTLRGAHALRAAHLRAAHMQSRHGA